jgi:hypothetical protein
LPGRTYSKSRHGIEFEGSPEELQNSLKRLKGKKKMREICPIIGNTEYSDPGLAQLSALKEGGRLCASSE